MAKYPGAIPSLNEIFQATDYVDWTNASKWDDLRAELRAALVELGILPKGAFATVKARLDDIYPQFHDRGDPVAWDWTQATLTTDGGWHDLDLSSIVPAGAKAVLLVISITDDAVGTYLQFRKNGNSGIFNRSTLLSQIANESIEADFVVTCDTNRIVEYRGANVTFTTIIVLVKGWWK